jgi:hypothetical protein
MEQFVVGFDITQLTPKQLIQARIEFLAILSRAKIDKKYAVKQAYTITKTLMILKLIEAFERGGIIGYHQCVKSSGIKFINK